MKILLGHPNRDLLACCQTLLTEAGHQVVSTFDGTQMVTKIAAGGWDLAVVGSEMPRISTRQLVKLLNDQSIPVVVLLDGAVSTGMLLDSILANGYLEMPFAPKELIEMVEQVYRTATCNRSFDVGAFRLVPAEFHLNEKIRLTAREINLLIAMAQGDCITGNKAEAYVSALNNKFMMGKVPSGIRYEQKHGYRLVTEHE